MYKLIKKLSSKKVTIECEDLLELIDDYNSNKDTCTMSILNGDGKELLLGEMDFIKTSDYDEKNKEVIICLKNGKMIVKGVDEVIEVAITNNFVLDESAEDIWDKIDFYSTIALIPILEYENNI